MLRRMIVNAVVLVALVGSAGTAQSQVSVNIGINLPAPPPLVVVPATPVMYAPGVGVNYFFYGGEYFVFSNGAWYVSAGHNGPWMVLAPEFVPRPILAVPVRYYRHVPGEWRHAKREGPPPWAPAWGRRWEERERHREGVREERHEERRDDHRRG